MHVCEGMVVSIPASEAEIKAANGRISIVDNDNFFVMRPDLNAICSMLHTILRWKVKRINLLPRYGQGDGCTECFCEDCQTRISCASSSSIEFE